MTSTIILAVVGVLAVAVHLGLGGLVLANSGWTSAAADIVLAIVAGKVLLIVIGRVVFRRGRAAYRIARTPHRDGSHRVTAVSGLDSASADPRLPAAPHRTGRETAGPD
jgi:ABC-type nickel/cobalt efflux system permease component RcnA